MIVKVKDIWWWEVDGGTGVYIVDFDHFEILFSPRAAAGVESEANPALITQKDTILRYFFTPYFSACQSYIPHLTARKYCQDFRTKIYLKILIYLKSIVE